MKLNQKLAALASTAMLLTNILSAGIASAATNTASASLVSGGKTITAGTSATLTGAGLTVAATASTISGTVVDIAVDNYVGDGATWTASSTITQLGLAGASIVKSGDRKTLVTITGTYNPTLTECSDAFDAAAVTATVADDTIPCGDITLTVLTMDGTTPATVTATSPDGTTSEVVTLAGGVGSYKGLTLTYAANASWVVADAVYGHVDIMPFTLITATPSGVTATGGGASTFSTTAQAAAAYTGATATSTGRADVIAATGAGYGSYTYDLGLSVSTHGYARVGTYTATLTLSIA